MPPPTPSPPQAPYDQAHHTRRALILTIAALVAATLLATAGPSALAPAAGPWAARLLGHSCGISDLLPIASVLLALAGPLAIYLATRRHLSRARLIPLGLWAFLWTLAGLASFINTLE